MRNKAIDFIVGIFMLAGLLGLILLAFKVSGLTDFVGTHDYYDVTAEFSNVGGLRVRAPVSVAGVTIGRVNQISLDPITFRAKVLMQIDKHFNELPKDSSASILTEGLLGSNYISVTPGFDNTVLKAGDYIETTHSALILENLVGQLMYSLKNGSNDSNDKSDDSNNKNNSKNNDSNNNSNMDSN